MLCCVVVKNNALSLMLLVLAGICYLLNFLSVSLMSLFAFVDLLLFFSLPDMDSLGWNASIYNFLFDTICAPFYGNVEVRSALT